MEQERPKQSRRNFLFNLGVLGALLLSAIVFIRDILAYLVPPRKKKKFHKYLVAEESELPVGKAKEITISKKPVFVIRLESGYRVYSGVCTHLGCIVRWEEDKQRFIAHVIKEFSIKTATWSAGRHPAHWINLK